MFLNILIIDIVCTFIGGVDNTLLFTPNYVRLQILHTLFNNTQQLAYFHA